jgi:integrase
MRHRGWWVLRYRERVGIGGKMKTVQRARRLSPIDATHKTRASVRQLAEDILEPLNKKAVSPLTVTTLGDFCERVYLPFVKEHKRPSTLRGYKQMWNDYVKSRCGASWLREVKTCNVQSWLEEIAKQHGLSKTTLCHIKHFLSGIFRYAAQQDYFDSSRANPVKLAAIPASAPNGSEGSAYSLEEISLMLRVLPDQAATVVATAAYTGLRLGELRGLEWEAYTPATDEDSLGLLYVRRSIWRNSIGEPKTKKSKAPVPVIPQLAKRLAAHRKACGKPIVGPIFANTRGKPLALDWLYQTQMKDVLRHAGVNWTGWHAFRRGLASNLNRLGVDDSIIQSILRHSTVSVTQNHYIKTAQPDAIAAMQQLSAALECSDCAPNSSRKVRLAVQ